MFSRVPLAACLVLGLVFSACGQGVNPRAAVVPQIQLVPIQLTGTVAGVKPGMIAVTTAAGEIWALSIPPKIEVRVTGNDEDGRRRWLEEYLRGVAAVAVVKPSPGPEVTPTGEVSVR